MDKYSAFVERSAVLIAYNRHMRKSFFSFCILLACAGSSARAIEQQEQDSWCWAACIQDALSQAGLDVPQADIVARLTGWVSDRPAQVSEVRDILLSYHFRAREIDRPASPQELYSALMSGWKVIAFVKPTNGPTGHFIMLEGIEPQYGGIMVADPWTGQTQPFTLNSLYYGWRWYGSVVVGRPLGIR